MATLALPLAAWSLSAASHPTLSTMWTATVNEVQVGVVHESEHFVSDNEMSATNPSAKWTNYTDGSCQRLIYQTHYTDASRYLLGCDAVQCCVEQGDGPLEYQIPTVHPPTLAPVTSLGNSSIKLFNGDVVVAEGYSWKFVFEGWTAYVKPRPGKEFATLHRWEVRATGQTFTNDYVNYTVVPKSERAAFLRTFRIPKVCEGNIVTCNDAHKQGQLTHKSLAFLRAGRKPARQH